LGYGFELHLLEDLALAEGLKKVCRSTESRTRKEQSKRLDNWRRPGKRQISERVTQPTCLWDSGRKGFSLKVKGVDPGGVRQILPMPICYDLSRPQMEGKRCDGIPMALMLTE
jgi:hypothetical protein